MSKQAKNESSGGSSGGTFHFLFVLLEKRQITIPIVMQMGRGYYIEWLSYTPSSPGISNCIVNTFSVLDHS